MRYLLFTFLLFTFTSALAQDDLQSLQAKLQTNPNDIELLLKLGIVYHDKGLAGDKKAVKKSEKLLVQALELDKTNALALAYLGSVYTLKGRYAFFPWNKMKNVEKGIDKLDKAIDMAPDNLQVRLVRAMNSLNLPSFFHRLQYSLKDFTYIINHEEFQHWPAQQQAMVYYNLGVACEKDDKAAKAKKNFEKAIEIAPQSHWAKLAKNH